MGITSLLNYDYWILQTIAMMVTALLIPGLRLKGPIPAFLTVVAIALINSQLWDAALFFKIPDNFTAQAGTLLLANGVLFWVVVKLLPGIEISGILPALAAPVVFTVLSLAVAKYRGEIDWPALYDKAKEQVALVKGYIGEVSATGERSEDETKNQLIKKAESLLPLAAGAAVKSKFYPNPTATSFAK